MDLNERRQMQSRIHKLKRMYDDVVDLQKELRYEIESYPLLSDADPRLIQALAAAIELQAYVAGRLAEEPDDEWWWYAMAHVAKMEGADAAALNEQLQADPNAEVPAHIKQHVMEMLGCDLQFYKRGRQPAQE